MENMFLVMISRSYIIESIPYILSDSMKFFSRRKFYINAMAINRLQDRTRITINIHLDSVDEKGQGTL
jgi:hypothetical protein